jgi:hypothetical protein
MKDCPHCGAAVDGLACQSCGYTEGQRPRAADAKVTHDHRCAFVDEGRRCDAPGSICRNGSDYLCSRHDERLHGGSARTPEGLATLREIIARQRFRRQP